MPMYEYLCADCRQPFELLVRSAALADSVVCQHCHGANVRRLISSFATTRGSAGPATALAEAPRATGGGCACGGGGCACGGH
jgi:putative FmdB family regulatory protein